MHGSGGLREQRSHPDLLGNTELDYYPGGLITPTWVRELGTLTSQEGLPAAMKAGGQARRAAISRFPKLREPAAKSVAS